MTDGTSEGLAARRAAFDLLHAVLAGKRSLDEALETVHSIRMLDARDRAFARLLAATVLRRQGQLDALIRHAVTRGLPRNAVAVRDVLRLGLAQLLILGTPPHAAVATAVELTETIGLSRFKGLVNAVLRRMSREGPALVSGQDAPRLNTPDWLWQSWEAAYGAETAHGIAAAHLSEAPLDITPKESPLAWADRLEATLLPTGTLRRPASGAVADLPGFAEGAWWVQDMAAALPARMFGPVSGLRIADLCAAPGGKTAQLAAAGARVTAIDRSARRLERVEANLERLGLKAELLVSDALRYRPDEPFDAVLLDAPCSSTGTIRRHPDIQRLKAPGDIAKLAETQARLLDHALDLVKPGGLLVWCTCSLQPEEGPRQIERLLASGASAERVLIAPDEVGGLTELLTPAGDIRSLPCHLAALGGIDGFHIARLRRIR
ncbi:MAG TPA: transcription antitermination factor NusB [Alphaproteobacteria bacterium]|nr:transcription antitermination factor NusB [Alphaproteobacteria bacterium]